MSHAELLGKNIPGNGNTKYRKVLGPKWVPETVRRPAYLRSKAEGECRGPRTSKEADPIGFMGHCLALTFALTDRWDAGTA